MNREQIIQDIIVKLQQLPASSEKSKIISRLVHIIEMKQFRDSLQGKAQQQGFNTEDDILAFFT